MGKDLNMTEKLRIILSGEPNLDYATAVEERPGVTPRIRRRVELPNPPVGHVITRFHGEIVFIPRRTDGDTNYGNSQYTTQQVQVLTEMLSSGRIIPKSKGKPEIGGPW